MRTQNYSDHAAILIAAVFYGLITVAGQYFSDQGFSLYEISLLLLFVSVPLSPLAFLKKYRIRREFIGFYLTFGLIGAGLQISQFAGIVLGVPVAVVALLLYTQPIWTTLLGKWLLGEQITRRKVISAGLALLGILVLVDPFALDYRFEAAGIISGVLAGFFLSLWVIWGRKSGLRKQHYVTTVFGYTFFSSMCLLLAYPFLIYAAPGSVHLRLSFLHYFDHMTAVAGFVLFAGLLPASLAFHGMRNVEASIAGILLLFEPVSAAVLAYFFFGQAFTANIWLGGSLILAANVVMLGLKTKLVFNS